MNRYLLISFFHFILFCNYASAQTGAIKGVIRDAKTQEAIIGGNVVIKGTSTGASTNLEGEYIIPKLAAGTYTISISYISYKTKEIANVTVPSGKTVILNATIEEDAAVLEGVVITAERITSSEVSVINEVREAEQVVTGISAEQINKSQDNNAAQVIQRVPGVSIVDNRFVMIRGLSERYNNVMINDAISPSTEVDSRAFSFDLVPSNIIDRMLIFKSGSPEYPGDFAGGVIKIFTKSVPNENATTLSLNLGNRFGTTFENFQLNRVGGEILPFDNGNRSIPSSFPNNLGNISLAATNALASDLRNNFSFDRFSALPDGSATLAISRRMNVGDKKLTTVSQLSYSSRYQYARISRFRYQDFNRDEQRSPTQFEFTDDNYNHAVRIGAISNWSLIVNPNFKIDFRNMFNQLSENEMTFRQGVNTLQRSGDQFNNFAFRYMSRSIFSSQLQGKHDFNNNRTSLTWVGGYNYIFRNEPDFRRVRFVRPLNNPEAPLTNIDPPGAALFDNARFYSRLNENTVMHSTSVEHKIALDPDADENQLKFATLRTGYYLENKDRSFEARWLSYTLPSNLPTQRRIDLLSLPLDRIFSPENVGADGWRIVEGTNPSDRYDASTTIVAGYVGGTIPIDKFNVSGGFRVENSRQRLNSQNRNLQDINVDLLVTPILPSLNIGFNLNEYNILRAAYCRTINRPEFRELAEFLYYDFNLEANVVGNPNLKVATIDNFDVRWEFYPTEAEIISVGGFIKNFTNPIETYVRQAGESQQFEFGNALSAQSLGVELEFRKNFSTWTSLPVLSDLGVNLNASLIRSTVNLGTVVAQERNRILQGQSPYLINAALYYTKLDKGINASVVYNVFGPRIFTVGDNLFPTVYELPRHTIDLTLNKKLTNRLEGKLGIQDLLNYEYRFFQDSNRDTRIQTSIDEPIFLFRRGTVFTMGLAIKL
jgi:TonB-dependent receptor